MPVIWVLRAKGSKFRGVFLGLCTGAAACAQKTQGLDQRTQISQITELRPRSGYLACTNSLSLGSNFETRFGVLHCDSQQAQSALGMVSEYLEWGKRDSQPNSSPTAGKPSQLPNEKASKEQRPVGLNSGSNGCQQQPWGSPRLLIDPPLSPNTTPHECTPLPRCHMPSSS